MALATLGAAPKTEGRVTADSRGMESECAACSLSLVFVEGRIMREEIIVGLQTS